MSYLLWRPCCIATCENFFKSVIHWISVTLYIAIFYSSTNTVDLNTYFNISRKEMHFFYALPRMVRNLDTPYHERTSYLTLAMTYFLTKLKKLIHRSLLFGVKIMNSYQAWYFVTIIVLTYCEKNLFQCNFEFFQGNEAKKSESRKSFANSRPKAKNL